MKNIRQNLCHDKILFCCNTDYGNMEKLVETEEKSFEKRFMSRQGDISRDDERRRNSGRDR